MWTSQVYGHRDKMARTKTHRTSQKNGVYKDATDISITLRTYPDYVELPPWYGQWITLGFKPVFRCSKPHPYSTLIGEEYKVAFSS